MAGPYPPNYGFGAGGRPYPPPHGGPYARQPFSPSEPVQQYPDDGTGPAAYPASSAYPGMLPPPVQYPKRRRWGVFGKALLAVVVVGAIVAATALVIGARNDGADSALTDASAKVAIQNFLDALSDGDTETVARNTLCGIYDAVSDRKSDEQLARLNSAEFGKQFESAEVTSIDKMVFSSSAAAQVLFTMRVVPASRNQRGNDEEQAIAQLLAQGDNPDDILVCSYLVRSAGQY